MAGFFRTKGTKKAAKKAAAPKPKSATRTTKDKPAKAAKPTKIDKAAKKAKFEKMERDKVSELLGASQELMVALRQADHAKAVAGEMRKAADAKQAVVNQIVQDLQGIRNGEVQPGLPFVRDMKTTKKAGGKGAKGDAAERAGEPQVDQGAAKPLEDLIEFGMTKAKVDALIETVGGKTIGHLEKYQRENIHWTTDTKGFGEEWITKLQDAHEQLRRRFPMPDPVTTQAEKKDGESGVTVSVEDGQGNVMPAETAKLQDAIDKDLAAKGTDAETADQEFSNEDEDGEIDE